MGNYASSSNSNSNSDTNRGSLAETSTSNFYEVRLKPFSKTSPLKYEIVCKAIHGETLSSVISKVNVYRRPGKEVIKVMNMDGTDISMNDTLIDQNMILYV
jgi:hypothetical protein